MRVLIELEIFAIRDRSSGPCGTVEVVLHRNSTDFCKPWVRARAGPSVRQTNYKTKIAFCAPIGIIGLQYRPIYYAVQLRFGEGVLYGQDSLSASRGPFWDRLSTPITTEGTLPLARQGSLIRLPKVGTVSYNWSTIGLQLVNRRGYSAKNDGGLSYSGSKTGIKPPETWWCYIL